MGRNQSWLSQQQQQQVLQNEKHLDESESESNHIDEDLDPIKVLRATWESLDLPVTEESVLGKWYAVVHTGLSLK